MVLYFMGLIYSFMGVSIVPWAVEVQGKDVTWQLFETVMVVLAMDRNGESLAIFSGFLMPPPIADASHSGFPWYSKENCLNR